MQVTQFPSRYSPAFQVYQSSSPYPMNFMQAPSYSNQILIDYAGQPALQGLSTVRGPFMYPVRAQIAYPLTHSVPDPFQQSYINLMGEMMGVRPVPDSRQVIYTTLTPQTAAIAETAPDYSLRYGYYPRKFAQ